MHDEHASLDLADVVAVDLQRQRPLVERADAKPGQAGERVHSAMAGDPRARDRARQVIVGISIGLARLSTTPARSPLSRDAPSPISTGRLPKYVYGSAFWMIAVTPLTGSPPSSTSSRGGRIR